MSENQGIFISERPSMYPAACSRCGSSVYDGRKYVDFGVDRETPPVAEPGVVNNLERHDVVYLCSLCIREIFKAVFPNDGLPVAQIESDLADALQKVELQRAIMSTMKAQLDKLRDPVAFAEEETLDDSGNSDLSDSVDSADSSDPVSSDETKSNVPKITSTKSGVIEPDPEPGHKNIPSLTELLQAKH